MSEIIVNKIKLKPNKNQEKLFEKYSKSCIFIYNWSLYQNNHAYDLRLRWLKYFGSFSKRNKNGKIDHEVLPENCRFISKYDLCKKLTTLINNNTHFKWLKLSPSAARVAAVGNADAAWQNYFSGKSKRSNSKNGGKPNRKKYAEFNYSYYAAVSTPSYPKKTASKSNHKKIQLAKIGWVKMTRPLYHEGFICGVVVSKKNDGWYAAVSVKDFKLRHKRKDIKKCGIDLGLKDLAILYDGVDTKKYNVRDFDKIKNELRLLDKKISHKYESANHNKKKNDKKFYSKSYKKLRHRQNILKGKLSEIKEHDLHNLSTDIVLNHKNITVEDLNISDLKDKTKQIQSTNKIKKSINAKYDDNNLGKFKVMLDYKARLYGSNIIKADRYFASSKICSSCGKKNEQLTVDIRRWICESCGIEHDRDENAAKNLFKYKI